jgi:NitT/TauT family transport system substrate-binding protein
MAMKVSDMPLFLRRNEIDGFIAWAPHPTRAVAQGFGHELLTSHDIMPGHQCCVLVTRESTLKNDSEIASKVLQVYLEAYEWFRNNPAESMEMLVKNTGIAEDTVLESLKLVSYPNPPFVNVPSMEMLARALIENDLIKTIKAEDVVPFVNSLYRPELLEKLTGTKRPGT